MNVRIHESAGDFLRHAGPALEAREVENNLILGIALQLKAFPARLKTRPFLATIEDQGELIAAALMTPPHQLLLFCPGPGFSPALEQLALHLQAGGWPVSGVMAPSRIADEFARSWSGLTGEPAHPAMHQRLYALEKVDHPRYPAGRFRPADRTETGLIADWIYGFMQEAFASGDRDQVREMAETRIAQELIFVWDDGGLASMAARTRPTPRGICVSMVYTPPPLRGRGYATACVARLSQLSLDCGKEFCCLFTDLANPVSNRIYQRIGYRPVCDLTQYKFGTPEA